MGSFSPFCPVDVRILQKQEGEAALRAAIAGCAHRLLVLTTPSLCARLSLTALFTALQGDGHCLHLITTIPPNPTVEDLAAILTRLRQENFHPTCILAIGGGSCLDMAKGISALWHLPRAQAASPEWVRQAVRTGAYRQGHPFIEWLAMPTTSGTGSEVTPWATIWDPENQQKLSIDCPGLFAKAAVLIPQWTVTMPASLTLSTGLDALSHAMESFWARARTPLSQALALSAIGAVRHSLPRALLEPAHLLARQEMCTASLLAGLAFSLTRTTACHSISYPLTMDYGIPHGLAAALTLPAVMARNLPAVAEIAQINALFKEEGGFQAWLLQVSAGVQSLRLSAFGVEPDQLPAIARLAFTQGRMDNNPVAFSLADVEEILRACL